MHAYVRRMRSTKRLLACAASGNVLRRGRPNETLEPIPSSPQSVERRPVGCSVSIVVPSVRQNPHSTGDTRYQLFEPVGLWTITSRILGRRPAHPREGFQGTQECSNAQLPLKSTNCITGIHVMGVTGRTNGRGLRELPCPGLLSRPP